MCTGLGLVAHLDGSHVRLLAFSSPRGRSAHSDGASVADIDLEAGWTSQNPHDKGGEAASALRREGEGGPSVGATFRGPARGLSWGRCTHSADLASMEGGDSWAELEGSSRGAARGEIACHIAVACGPEVLLWKVSRATGETRIGGPTEEGRAGNRKEFRYRYSTVSVRTDWQRSCRGFDRNGGPEREKAMIPNGNIRCLSFRPRGPGGATGSLSAATGGAGEGESVPLTAWYDAGAAVLG